MAPLGAYAGLEYAPPYLPSLYLASMLPAPLKYFKTDILTLRERGDLRIGVDLRLLEDELLLLCTMVDDDILLRMILTSMLKNCGGVG